MFLWIPVKKGFDLEPAFLKPYIAADCSGQPSGADHNQMIFLIQSEDFSDLVIEMTHIVSISLLSEPAEKIQILPNL